DWKATRLATVVIPVVVKTASIAVPVAIPAVIMLEALVSGTVPIALIIHAAFIAWVHPDRTLIRRLRPVPIVPAISISVLIPVAVHPGEAGSGRARPDAHNTRRRWLADADAE